MVTVKFVYSNFADLEKLIDADLSEVFLEMYDEGSYKEKKLAYKIKAACGARLTPFIAVYDGDELIKAFYSEADEDVVKSLTNYLNASTSNQ